MSLPDPITRKETLLNAAATGQTTGLPDPITREETYLKAIAENSGGGGGGAVSSVNGKTGAVVLDASDVGALPSSTTIPTKTSDLNNDSNFVADASYVHTDNNYDATAKGVVDGVGTALGGKADKVSSATSGNFAGLDSNGNITDSGVSSTDISNKDNLKLASSGATATGEIRFGVDGNGNYGYIKAGADTVTPFKNPSGNKDIGTIATNGTTTDIDVADYATASVTVNVPPVAPTHIYGIRWVGSTYSTCTRTDDAVGFSNPTPYFSGMTGSASSPFDNCWPWSGMRKEYISGVGVVVRIPKFWWKWTTSGDAMQLQIADSATSGFYVSPAHINRGDGAGERDFVYVGRYHCNNANYMSSTNYTPLTSLTRSAARDGIHSLGSTVWQWDYAMWWTINMLYLVEYADWDAQATIGLGCGNNSSTEKTGKSDLIPFHTGIPYAKSSYGVGAQYREIENLYGGVSAWVDGIRFDTNGYIYCFKNPSEFSDTTGGTIISVAEHTTASGWIKSWINASNLWWAKFPKSIYNVPGTKNYTGNWFNGIASTSVNALIVGHNYTQDIKAGMFSMGGQNASSGSQYIGCRLMVLP